MTDSKQKTVMILTGPMGSGHMRAALAIKEVMQQDYPDVKVLYVDTTSWMPLLIRWIFLGLYPFLLFHLPTFWRLIHNMNNHAGKGLFTFLFDLFDRRIKVNIRRNVRKNKVDLLICIHFYPGYIVDKMKRQGLLSIPSTLVVTDHVGHRIYARKHQDLIFVSNQESLEQFEKWGVPQEKLRIAGCPIFPKFGKKYSDAELEDIQNELQLKSHHIHIMLTMGGWTVGDMVRTAKRILMMDKDFALLVMTAHNQKLYRQFAIMAMDDDRIMPISYTDQIEKYMAVCSCVITKPGGITTSECIAMKKPMILVEPIPGHEEKNLEYLVKCGVAVSPEENQSLEDAVTRMKARYPEIFANIDAMAPRVIKASSTIVEESMKLIADRKD